MSVYAVYLEMEQSEGRVDCVVETPKYASVLRTQEDVKRLRRRNYNSSANSAHAYGTTFDVSCKRFEKLEDEDGCPLGCKCRYPKAGALGSAVQCEES